MSIKYKSIKEQLLSKVIKTDLCWNWIGSTNPDGYGRIKIKEDYKISRNQQAHRVSYEIYKGKFDKKLNVLHSCDNPRCVNPEHLFLGTQRDNVIDMYKKNKGSMKGLKHFKKEDILNIRKLFKQGFNLEYLSNKFKRHKSSIRAIVTNRIYKRFTNES